MNAVERRQELRDELVHVQGVIDANHALVVRYDNDLKRNEKVLDEAYVDQVRGKDVDIAALTRDRHELSVARADAVKQRDAAGTAKGRIEREIAALQAAYLEQFLGEAERMSSDAEDALLMMRSFYVAAQEAWGAAQSEWNAIHVQLRDYIVELDAADEHGRIRDPSVVARHAMPKSFPFPQPASIFDQGHSPMPQALTRVEPTYEDLDENTDVAINDAVM